MDGIPDVALVNSAEVHTMISNTIQAKKNHRFRVRKQRARFYLRQRSQSIISKEIINFFMNNGSSKQQFADMRMSKQQSAK